MSYSDSDSNPDLDKVDAMDAEDAEEPVEMKEMKKMREFGLVQRYDDKGKPYFGMPPGADPTPKGTDRTRAMVMAPQQPMTPQRRTRHTLKQTVSVGDLSRIPAYWEDPRGDLQRERSTIEETKTWLAEGKNYDDLPIYIILGHSSYSAHYTLVPPEGMSEDEVGRLGNKSVYDRIAGGFLIDEKVNNFERMPSRPAFYFGFSPFGYSTMCDQDDFEAFLVTEGGTGIKRMLLGEESFRQFSIMPDENENLIFPPGVLMPFRTFQFFDAPGINNAYYYGIVRANDAFPFSRAWGTIVPGGEGADEKIARKQFQKNMLHPNMVPEAKDLIEKSIDDVNSSVGLNEIIEAVGDGIYIDLGCNNIAINLKDHNSINNFR